MLPEDSKRSGDCDALAARLNQLAPTGAGSIQAKVFYEAGYRAGLEQQRVANTKRQFFLAAACLIVSVGAGVIAARLPFVRESQNLVQADPSGSALQPIADSSEHASSEPSEIRPKDTAVQQNDRESSKTDKSPPVPFVAQAFTKYVTTWSQRNTVSGNIKIGPIGSSWDDLVVAQTPTPGLQAAPPRKDELLLPEEALYRPFDLNPFRQVFRN